MSQQKSTTRADLLRLASLFSGISSPFILLVFAAFAGVDIQLWMIIAATLASFAMLFQGVRMAAKMGNDAGAVAVTTDTVSGVMTSAGKKHAPIEPVKWRAKDRDGDVVVHPAQQRQTILGFGAALTGASCAVINRMDDGPRDEVMHELFHPTRMNLSVNRVTMGSSDYSAELYSYCDDADPTMGKFTIERDFPYVLPVIKDALSYNRNMYLLASPWSPPAWMKPNGTMLGGAMSNTYFPAYGQYFVRFLEEYQHNGVNINAVTVQNEVEADQGGKMPACTWTKELECQFVANHLGPEMDKAGFSNVGIWMMDHNYDMEKRAAATLADQTVRTYCNTIAWHGYGGTAEAVSRVHAAHPESEHHFTEFNTFLFAPEYRTNWVHWGEQIGEAMRNWMRSYIMWNVALDEQGKPNIGPFQCGGLVTIDSMSGELTRSGGYWGMGHYSKFVKRGAVCVGSTGSVEGLTHVAFVNPNGEKVLVVTNAGAARTVTIEHSSDRPLVADVALDADSVTTLVWK